MPELKLREDVAQEDTWNVEDLFPSLEKWQGSYKDLSGNGSRPRWPELADCKGRLHEGAERLKETFDIYFKLLRELESVYCYAHLRHDEDTANNDHKTAYGQAMGLYHDFAQEASWIEPEILSLPEETLQSYLESPSLVDYRFHLEKIVLVKPYTLSPEKEELLAMAGKALQTARKAFSAINDADFDFGEVVDGKGEKHRLTHGSYSLYVRNQDRTLRKNTFESLQGKYGRYENTLCELLSGVVNQHAFNARARGYDSCLEAALQPKNIDTNVYHSLIKAVRENLEPLHKYMRLRKKLLGLDELHLYDMSVPITKDMDITMNYADAEEVIVQSVSALGEEYQQHLDKGLKDDRWVDRYENENKRSGAYSSGCYNSHPYILMNYKGLLRDVFTLAHEAGHSMHSLYSRKNQPFHYSDYSIFVAEVASTFNEDLLSRLLMERAQSKEERIFLVNQKVEDIRNTLFRQTMFAEFELMIHDWVEKDIPLTPAKLNEEYHKLAAVYFGPDVVIDKEIQWEWARIPHFYYNFYVYQYATGISAALCLADRVVKEGAPARDAYLSFLKGGSSQYPVDILRMAGVDMCTPDPVKSAIQRFAGLVDDLEELTS